MANIEWIIFDLGGIVVRECGDSIINAITGKTGVDRERLLVALKPYHDESTQGNCTLLDMYASAFKDLSITLSPREMLDQHLEIYHAESTEHDADVVAFIQELRQQHNVVCLTNTEPEILAISSATGIFDYFQRAFNSVDLGLKKPDPEIFEAVLNELACPPGAAVLIDDRPGNVEGAKAVGMHAILFTELTQLKADLLPLVQ